MAEEKKHIKRKFLFNPLRRPLPYLGLMLALLLMIFQRTIRNYVSDAIGEILVNSVQEATGGEYKISYDLVRYDIISSELRISNFSIELDTSAISKENYLKKRPNLIDVNTPIVVIKLRSIFPLIFKDQLLVSYVGADKPKFDLIRSAHSTSMKNVAEQSRKDVLGIVNSYFAALEIDSFRIKSGSFSIESQNRQEPEIPNIHVGEFTTTLKNFRLDSLSPSIILRGISATSAELEVLNQDIYLPETRQNIHFDRFWLSSKESTITLDSLVLNQLTADSTKDETDIKIPRLSIRGLDFEKAFNENILHINRLRINKPTVKHNQFDTNSNTEETNTNSIYKYIKGVRIDTVDLNHGDVFINSAFNSNVKDINFRLLDYLVSPDDWEQHKPISEITIQSFSASDIEQELPDSIHKATINKFVYDANKDLGSLNNIKINPISGRNTYVWLKARKTKQYTYNTIKKVTLFGFHPEQLLLNQMLQVDSIEIDRPKSTIISYPLMRVNEKETKIDAFPEFNINRIIVKNGSIKLKNYKNKQSQTTELDGYELRIHGLSNESLKKEISSNTELRVNQGFTELTNIGHTARFTNLTIFGSKNIFAQSLDIQPDSTNLPYNQINAHLRNTRIKGIDLTSIQNTLTADTISVGSMDFRGDFSRENFKRKNGLKSMSINSFNLHKSNIAIALTNSNYLVNDVELSTSNIILDSLSGPKKSNVEFKDLLINFGKFRINNRKDTTLITGNSGYYSEQDSTLFAKGLRYKTPRENVVVRLNATKLSGISKQQFIHNKIVRFRNGTLVGPSLSIVFNNKRAFKNDSIALDRKVFNKTVKGLKFDTLAITHGDINVQLPDNSLLTIARVNGKTLNYSLDSISTVRQAINAFDGSYQFIDFNLTGDTDSLSISKLYFDTESENIWSDSIRLKKTTPTQTITFLSPGFAIREINIPSLLENKLDVRQFSLRNSYLGINQTDTTTNKLSKFKLPDIKLPIKINVGDISILNTRFSYKNKYKPYLPFSNIRLDIEMDSLNYTENTVLNLIHNTNNTRIYTYNFSYKLPDSLNTIGFDTLLVTTKNKGVRISNFRYTPRYNRDEYGKVAGFQADWKNLVINDLSIQKVDFIKALEEKTFQCTKIEINNSTLDLFKDKQLRYPSERVIPMLQERIRNVKAKILLDSIEINNLDITQTTRQSSGLTEGSISFENTNGVITNISNDSTQLSKDRMMKVSANSKIMGEGDLSANFVFDMLDPDDVFFFDANLGPMQANEFNDILEATAFVKVKSGNIKSINLQATANSSYAFGNMTFLYNNLKVEAFNKKNLKTRGMGKVLKSFFANTFVVKKNNSKYRLFGRRGSMYYERDISRISLDYAAKTALSGVVSSIGARNNRKEIKRIQKEDKQKRDLELKLKKEQEKAAKKTANK